MNAVLKYASLVKFAHTVFAMPFAMVGFVYGLRYAPLHNPRWPYIVLVQVILCMVFARNAAMGFNRWADRRIDKAQKAMKGGDKKFAHEVEVFTELLEHLNKGKLARTFDVSDEDRALIATSDLLTLKKTIYVANMSENEVNEPESSRHYMAVKTLADSEGSQVIPICAKLEADIAELDDPEEKAMFMEELGVAESGLHKLIKASYTLLGLISFLTAGSDECRAWTIKKGTKAPQAAGKIHTDFERGFIRAEVIAFDDMKACGTMAAAKAKGLVRSEGKEYVMKDGDIVNFLFNV